MHDLARPFAVVFACHYLASISKTITQTWEVCSTLVTSRRLHPLAAHGHAPADFREGDACAKRFDQQFALMCTMAIADMAYEFDHRDLVILQSRDRIVHKPRSAHPKIFLSQHPIESAGDFYLLYRRSTSAGHMRIDSFISSEQIQNILLLLKPKTGCPRS
ncbi:hypothetical protein FHT80_001179 [Rhizobium sp. BK226]|nr:hypothetical protein [Rhizobium sp. BK112]MBB3372074.1 hypothetical protein [Rhizobium sp. BK077]MBB4111863.1 hypothetical protein [Rhizobium sp. BK226]MBB4182638.1 hypothetical protein [Rhizobium sp. BK109]